MSNLWNGGDIPYERKYDGRWTPYAPSWTSSPTPPAIADGSFNGAYLRQGQLCFFTMVMQAGPSTTFGAGTWVIGLPPLASAGTLAIIGAFCLDFSASTLYIGNGWQSGASTFLITADASGNGFFSTFPFAWASGDSLVVSGWYPIA